MSSSSSSLRRTDPEALTESVATEQRLARERLHCPRRPFYIGSTPLLDIEGLDDLLSGGLTAQGRLGHRVGRYVSFLCDVDTSEGEVQ